MYTSRMQLWSFLRPHGWREGEAVRLQDSESIHRRRACREYLCKMWSHAEVRADGHSHERRCYSRSNEYSISYVCYAYVILSHYGIQSIFSYKTVLAFKS